MARKPASDHENTPAPAAPATLPETAAAISADVANQPAISLDDPLPAPLPPIDMATVDLNTDTIRMLGDIPGAPGEVVRVPPTETERDELGREWATWRPSDGVDPCRKFCEQLYAEIKDAHGGDKEVLAARLARVLDVDHPARS